MKTMNEEEDLPLKPSPIRQLIYNNRQEVKHEGGKTVAFK